MGVSHTKLAIGHITYKYFKCKINYQGAVMCYRHYWKSLSSSQSSAGCRGPLKTRTIRWREEHLEATHNLNSRLRYSTHLMSVNDTNTFMHFKVRLLHAHSHCCLYSESWTYERGFKFSPRYHNSTDSTIYSNWAGMFR